MKFNEEIKKPYVKVAVSIFVIVIVAMHLSQSYWKNTGVKMIYKEYPANEELFTNNSNIPDGIFILSGNYSYISTWINTSKVNCSPNEYIKLLVVSQKDVGNFKNIIVMDAIEGCRK
jgi:hypothetical protein